METITIDNDIRVLYTTATSFPDGILAAHERLHSVIPFSTDRKYFGISRPEDGAIIYRAAAEEKSPGEGERLGFKTLVLAKGSYVCQTINDYMEDVQRIERSFKELLASPGLDPQGYCVEWYLNDKDLRCMVRLAS